MTPKERIIAAMKFEPVDRLPFWPKLFGVYETRWGRPETYFHDLIGSDRVAWLFGASFSETRKHTAYSELRDGDNTECRYETDHGTLRMRLRYGHPVEHPVKTKQDIEIMACWFRDAEVTFDPARLEASTRRYAEFGQKAFIIDDMGESSLMRFIEYLAGIEQGHYLIHDYPGEVEDLFDAMHRNLLRRFEISAEHSPADSLHLTENTSTTLISPEQYDRFCFPQISAYGHIAKRAGRMLMLHMCGHLKKLLPRLSQLPATSFEAFTTPPVGNTTLRDGREGCPDKCLVGGTNAALWMQPAETIIAALEEQLAQLPHHRGLFLSSAGVMPPACSPETLHTVKRWIDAYTPRA